MKRSLALITLFFVSSLSVFGQIKLLVVAATMPTTIKFEGYRNFALPSFCDESGRSYVKLLQPGKGMAGPLFRISDKGVAEAEFDVSGALGNTFAVWPNGGIAAAHLQGKTKVIDRFDPNGEHAEEIWLEQPPVPFFPMQIAIFPSGGILLAGAQYQRGDEASTAVYSPEGQLIKQIALEGDAALSDRSSISRSVAITGDDGNVYLLRATSPPAVYAISSKGEVRHKIVVTESGPRGISGFRHSGNQEPARRAVPSRMHLREQDRFLQRNRVFYFGRDHWQTP